MADNWFPHQAVLKSSIIHGETGTRHKGGNTASSGRQCSFKDGKAVSKDGNKASGYANTASVDGNAVSE